MSDGNQIYDGPGLGEDPHDWGSDVYEPNPDEEDTTNRDAIDLTRAHMPWKLKDKPESMEQKQPDDEWEAISAQLDYWRDMDIEYWRQRREKEYEAYFNRKLKQNTESMEQKHEQKQNN